MSSIQTTENKSISCKAAVLWEFGKPYTIETIDVAPPQAREVRVRLVATGICHSDLLVMNGYDPQMKLPLVPGNEGAGIVESVGSEVSTVKQGDKVFTLFVPQCKKCKNCQGKISNYCSDKWGEGDNSLNPFMRSVGYDGKSRYSISGKTIYHYLGSSSFSEYVVIPETSCVKVNPKTPLEKACIMSCGFPTGYGASNNSVDIKPGQIVAVWGLGGVGLSAVAGCKDKSAGLVIGIDKNPGKEDIGRKMGCTHFINTKTEDVEEIINKLTNGSGLDFAFNCTSTLDETELAIKCLSTQGTLMLVGMANIAAKTNIPCKALFPQRTIKGSIIGGYKVKDDIPKLVDLYLNGKLPIIDHLISHKFHLERIHEGLELLRTGRCIRTVILF